MASTSVIKFILSSIKPFRWWVGAQVLVAIIWAIDLSLSPYLLKVMIDRMPGLLVTEAYNALLGPALLYLFMSLLIFVVFRFYDFIWLHINPFLKRHIGFVLMERMMQHAHHLFQDNFSGSLGNKIKDVMSGVPDLLKIVIDRFFSHGLAFLLAVGAVWTVNIRFAIALCIWVSIFITASLILSKKARHFSGVAAEVRSTVVGTIVDILSNMLSVRLFTARREEKNKLEFILDKYVKADQQRDWFFLKMRGVYEGSFIIYQSVVLFWLIQGFGQGIIFPGDFVLILTISLAIMNCLWGVSRDIINIAELAGNITQGLRIALSPLEIDDKPNAKPLVIRQGEITFAQVHFRYRNADPIFENKTVTILPGQKVGLVGYSGGGKTTFVNLILRLFDVTSGHILIDGQDISEVTQDSLRANIGMIPQDPSLFHRSLIENIRYGRLDATDTEVFEAARKAHADEFILALPQGYGSLVGERGVKLSGGQRQRIAIARAFLKNAPILLLDEATSQLDSVTERDIQDALWKLMEGKTTIVIAHRLSTLLHMDRLLAFDRGKIVEDGSHEELLSKGGLYKTLWNAQVDGFLSEYRDPEED
ncbi:MAG: ABC transporter ATP-binding protein [Candidatus Paracaedibacter sp.]